MIKATETRLLSRTLIAVSALLCSFPASAQSGPPAWNLELAQHRSAPTTVTMTNRCGGEQTFEIRQSEGMDWFELPADTHTTVPGASSKTVDVRIETAGLEVGLHTGLITVQCLSCRSAPNCNQDKDDILVRLKVLWPEGAFDDLAAADFVPSRVVALLEGANEKGHGKLLKEIGKQSPLEPLEAIGLRSIDAQLVEFRFRSPGASLFDLVQSVHRLPDVLLAQPAFTYQTLDSPYRDSYAAMQYGAELMNIELAHQRATGKGVKVAVIDSGVDPAQRDLEDTLGEAMDFIRDRKGSVAEVHGTAIASIIAAVPNNDFGIYGIAPDAELLAIRAFEASKEGSAAAISDSATVARALDHAIWRGAQVVNMSMGGHRRDPLMAQLVAVAWSRNIVLVAAIGNEGAGALPLFPAAFPQVLAVSAVDNQRQLYSDATTSKVVDVAAPGVDIMSAMPGDSFTPLSGTSMAAAHVSGLVALLLELNPALTPAAIRDLLTSTASDLGAPGSDDQYGHGLVDAARALEHAARN
jgi:subtilisin family serine protease